MTETISRWRRKRIVAFVWMIRACATHFLVSFLRRGSLIDSSSNAQKSSRWWCVSGNSTKLVQHHVVRYTQFLPIIGKAGWKILQPWWGNLSDQLPLTIPLNDVKRARRYQYLVQIWWLRTACGRDQAWETWMIVVCPWYLQKRFLIGNYYIASTVIPLVSRMKISCCQTKILWRILC